MANKALVFVNDADAAAPLLAAACANFDRVLLATNNPSLSGADETYLYDAGATAVQAVPAVTSLIAAQRPDAVLCEAGADGKLVAGYAAAALGTSPICDATSVSFSAEGLEAARMVYGGGAVALERSAWPAVVVAAPGAFEAGGAVRTGEVHTLELSAPAGVRLLGVEEAAPEKKVNLNAAKCVVGVGRGLGSEENLPLVEELAGLMGAEIGCTRPAAEEEHWYGKERYIGVSGCMIKPAVYLALGISGQVQHMVGVNQAKTIFAVDKSDKAPIVEQADHVLIGDIKAVLPRIIELLK